MSASHHTTKSDERAAAVEKLRQMHAALPLSRQRMFAAHLEAIEHALSEKHAQADESEKESYVPPLKKEHAKHR